MHSKEKTKKQAPSQKRYMLRIVMNKKMLLIILVIIFLFVLQTKGVFYSVIKEIHYNNLNSVSDYLKTLNTYEGKKYLTNKQVIIEGIFNIVFDKNNKPFKYYLADKNYSVHDFYTSNHSVELMFSKNYFKTKSALSKYMNTFQVDDIQRFNKKNIEIQGSFEQGKGAYFFVSIDKMKIIE